MDTNTKLKPFSEYNSVWQYTKDRSKYHFNKWQADRPGETYRVLGRLANTWQADLERIKYKSKPSTWKTITLTGGGNQKNLSTEKREHDLQQGGGHIDIELTNITDDFTDFPELQKIIDYFHLDRSQTRCHVQYTGQMFTVHIDPLHRTLAGPDAKPDGTYDYDPRDIVRITVMLEDWEPGQFIIYGNSVYQQWQAGDFHIHDWENIPHATANASHHSRVTLQITGLRTAETNKIIGTDNFKTKDI